MKTIIKTGIVALTLATGACGQAQAHMVWGYVPKGGPLYAVPHRHPGGGYTVQNAAQCPRTVMRRTIRSKVSLFCPDR